MFESFDAVLLARAQFAFTVAFHFIFPAITIGLASYLAVLNGLWLWKRDETYLELWRYWVKVFALVFAMGVVSGITMSYQFGTNWSVFSDRTGPILGPLMAYEVLTAFFMEAGFLGIMLFGRERVGERLHMVACVMVAAGTAISATWILSVNSWMHTPAGYSISESGQFVPEDWWAIVFNPSFPYRLAHTLTAAYLTTAFIVGGVGAWHLLRGRGQAPVRAMFSMAMWMAALVAPLQIFIGDLHGLNTLEHQPAKVMAMEGHFESHPEGAPLVLFGLPDQEAGEMRYALEIPHLSSLILVALGFAMLGVGLWSLWARWKGRLFEDRRLHRAALVMGPSGLVAVLAGWVTTEVGRQPWTVNGMMRTAESASPLEASAVGTSLVAFAVIYFIVFGAGVIYVLRLLGAPPTPEEPRPKDVMQGPIRTAGVTPADQVRESTGLAPGGQEG